MKAEKSKEILKLVDSFFNKNLNINAQADIINELNKQLRNRESINRFVGSFTSEEDKEIVKRKIYEIIREKISIAYIRNEYEEIIDAFNFIKTTKNYKNEQVSNKFIMKNMVIKALLINYMETQQKYKDNYEEANILLNNLNDSIDEVSVNFCPEQLSNEIRNLQLNNEIKQAIDNNNIWTEVGFIVPFPLGISEDYIELVIDNTKVLINTVLSHNPNSDIHTDSAVEREYDKYGLTTNTKITLIVNKYLLEKAKKVYQYDTEEYYSQIIIESIYYLNRIISKYRTLSNNYWISNVNIQMIDSTSIKFYADKSIFRAIPLSNEHTFKVSNQYSYNSSDENQLLRASFSNDHENEVWPLLLADSKNYLLIANLQEAIISLNTAFENYINSTFKSLLYKYGDESEVDEFFSTELRYDNFEGNDLITEEIFDALKKHRLLRMGYPSIYKIIAQYYKTVPKNKQIKLSKTQFNRKYSKISRYRNDIVHGNKDENEFKKLNDKHVSEAINAFVDLVSEINLHHFN